MSPSEPASPCVSICVLDENDLCVGCLRSGDEISRWGSMSLREKASTLEKVARRTTTSSSLISPRTF